MEIVKIMIKKLLSLSICIMLITPAYSYQQDNSPSKMTRSEVSKLLFVQEANIGDNLFVGAIVLVIAFSLNGGADSLQKYLRTDYKVFSMLIEDEEALAQKNKGNLPKTAVEEAAALKKEVKNIQGRLQRRAAKIGKTDKVMDLILKVNADVSSLENAKSAAEAKALRASIKRSLAKLSATKSSSASTRKALSLFVEDMSKRIKGTGGVMSVLLIGAASAALMLTAGNTYPAEISNTRLNVTRVMDATYKETPELLLLTAFQLKGQYGQQVVSDVVYENQANYVPLIINQKKQLNNPEVQAAIKKLQDYLGSTPDNHKAALVNSIKPS